VVDDGQDVDLGDDVVHLLQLDDLALLENFQREELLRLFIESESHPAEGAYRLEQSRKSPQAESYLFLWFASNHNPSAAASLPDSSPWTLY